MTYKVFIPTAGIGSRLGALTSAINKSLVSIDNRPIISHLIDQFPDSCNFVIALGHKGNLVKEFLDNIYDNKKIDYVKIDPFKGENSSLGYTLLSSKHLLQEPFVFISCDTLVKNKIPEPSHNWVGYSKNSIINQYRTLRIKSNMVECFKDKGQGEIGIDFPYIGLCGINDFNTFWEGMNSARKKNLEMGEVSGLMNLLSKKIKSYQMDWFDTGNIDSLKIAKKEFKGRNSPVILEKKSEAIWFINNKVVKFSTDKTFINNRVIRAKELTNYIPKIIKSSDHMYLYEKAQGEVLSQSSNFPIFKKLLSDSYVFWEKVKLSNEKKEEFKNKCLSFYKDKTLIRIEKFFLDFDKKDEIEIINGEKVEPLKLLLKKVNWDDLANGIPVRFHGDFHFENILWNQNMKKFTFLDWRQDFAGIINYGDIYYDLAKLLHGLIVSHRLIEKNDFQINQVGNNIKFELKRFHRDIEFENYFKDWCFAKNYDFKKVRLLTALIYLNISALHHVPYNYLLFALGKSMLNKELTK